MEEYYVGGNACRYEHRPAEEKLTLAVKEGNVDSVLSSLAEVDLKNPSILVMGYGLLCEACRIPTGTSEMVELLLVSEICSPNHDYGQGIIENLDTPLHFAAVKGNIDMVEVLLKFKAHPNATNSYDETPLHKACRYGHAEVVKQLLKAGANIDYRDCEQNTPLHHAVSHMQSETVAVLVNEGCNVDVLNDEEISPLDQAFMKEDFESVKELIKGGCRYTKDVGHVYYKDHYSNSILYSLLCINSLGTLKLVLENGYVFSPDFYSSVSNRKITYLMNSEGSNTVRTDIIKTVKDYQNEPLTLLKLCRIKIRNTINECRGQKSLPKSICQLALPHNIKTYLSFENQEEYQ